VRREPSNTPAANRCNLQPRFITFSGIDGSGKSTQIAAIHKALSQAGIKVRVLAFWDDIAALAWAREFLSHALFRGEKGVGSPGKPVRRRDKNIRSWYMTPARCFLYLLDALRLSAVMARVSAREDADIVILDRYLYDELANLDLTSRFARAYARFLLRLAPRPSLACLLDADPERAHQRKPEYSLDFVNSNRASYLLLSAITGNITVIPPMGTEEVTRTLLCEIQARVVPSAYQYVRLSSST
jgi:thymidylate kinase